MAELLKGSESASKAHGILFSCIIKDGLDFKRTKVPIIASVLCLLTGFLTHRLFWPLAFWLTALHWKIKFSVPCLGVTPGALLCSTCVFSCSWVLPHTWLPGITLIWFFFFSFQTVLFPDCSTYSWHCNCGADTFLNLRHLFHVWIHPVPQSNPLACFQTVRHHGMSRCTWISTSIHSYMCSQFDWAPIMWQTLKIQRCTTLEVKHLAQGT